MNWRRGLFRLWAVLSVAWAIPAFWMVSDCVIDNTCSAGRWGVTAFILGVPLAFLLFGTALLWAANGFKPKSN